MREDLTGRKYGRLTILGFDHSEKSKSKQGHNTTIKYWKCRCVCGETAIFPRADITGHKRNMCQECLDKFTKEAWLKGRKPNGIRLQTNLESVPRHKIDGFLYYFELNQYMFRDTFGVDYSESVARDEFNKIMNWEGRPVIG